MKKRVVKLNPQESDGVTRRGRGTRAGEPEILERIKCEFPEFCSALCLHINHEGRRGFNSVDVIEIKKGTIRLIGMRHCLTGSPKDRGTMLNFCPFCGTSLQWWGDVALKPWNAVAPQAEPKDKSNGAPAFA